MNARIPILLTKTGGLGNRILCYKEGSIYKNIHNKSIGNLRQNKTFKLISLAICFCFLFEQTGFAQTALELNLAAAFSNRLSNTFSQPQ
ncbi:hypothetical protein D4R78_05025, partial [bacterium]